MATDTSDPGVEVAHYLAGLYEVQRDADRLPDTTGLLYRYVPGGRRRRLVPLLPNGFACIALDANHVAPSDGSRQRGQVPERSWKHARIT